MARKQPKKKQVQVYEHNTHRYFESGRAAKLPLGQQYLAEFESDGMQIILLLFTRDHINGNKAFSNFMLNRDTGYLDVAHFDYNEDPDILDEFIEDHRLQPFDNYWILHNTLLQAKAISHEKGFPAPPALRIAMAILEPDEKAVTASSLFDGWSTGDTGSSTNRPKTKKVDGQSEQSFNFSGLSSAQQRALLTYHPEEVSGWSQDQWEQYFEKNRQMDVYGYLRQGISPLLYIFEKTLIDYEKALDPGLQDAVTRFEKSQVPLTDTPFKKIGTYDISQAELDLCTNYVMLIKDLSTSTDFRSLAKTIKGTIKEYPQNPQFYNLLIVCYQILNKDATAYRIAKSAYRLFPDYLFAIINYLDTLLQKRKYRRIPEILGNQYLLEDRYPDRTVFHYTEYKHYYRVLIIYLLETKQFAAGWRLYKAFTATTNYQKDDLQDVKDSLQMYIIILAKTVTLWLPSITADTAMKKQFYEQLGVS